MLPKRLRKRTNPKASGGSPTPLTNKLLKEDVVAAKVSKNRVVNNAKYKNEKGLKTTLSRLSK
jgi:hypothetical protein